MAVLTPAAAWAHTGGRIATDFKARVEGVRPAAPEIRARVLAGDLKLELTVSGRHTVVVLGLLGEPFLRFSATGVQANAASPTAWSSGVVAAGDAVRSAPAPIWRSVSHGHTFSWHEGRLRPRPDIDGGSTPRAVARWSVALLIDGRRARVVGSEWHAAGPSLLPWAVALITVLAGTVAAVRRCSRAALRWVAAVLVPVSVTAWLAGWVGILLDGGGSLLVVALAAAYAAVTVLLVAAALSATAGNARMATAGMVGALAAVFTVPEAEAFTRGFVLSALGSTGARVAALVAFAGGAALAGVCAPAMSDILSDDPLRRRLLAHHPAER